MSGRDLPESDAGRGATGDPLYRIRRLLLIAAERVSDNGRAKLRGLLAAGDPRREARDAWHAEETLRGIYRIPSRELAIDALDELARDLRDPAFSPELNRLGRTLRRWRTQITDWRHSRVTNGPTEAANTAAPPPPLKPTPKTARTPPTRTLMNNQG